MRCWLAAWVRRCVPKCVTEHTKTKQQFLGLLWLLFAWIHNNHLPQPISGGLLFDGLAKTLILIGGLLLATI